MGNLIYTDYVKYEISNFYSRKFKNIKKHRGYFINNYYAVQNTVISPNFLV